MIPAVQIGRAALGHQYFDPTFDFVAPFDLTLTLISHAIALNKIPVLKRFPKFKAFFDGKLFGRHYEFWTRTAANVSLVTPAILLSWAIRHGLANESPFKAFTVAKCLAAFGLCSVVYPTLQLLKTRIFKKIPMQGDKRRLEAAQADPLLRDAFAVLVPQSVARAMAIDIDPKQIESQLFTMLDNKVLSLPYENLRESEFPFVTDNPQFLELLIKTRNSEKERLKRKYRKQIIKTLLAEYPSARPELANEIERILFLGAPFTIESSMELHRLLSDRYRKQILRTYPGSFIDLFVSVGIAGGFGLYKTSEWEWNH